MSELTPELAAELASVCEQNTADIAKLLGSDTELAVEVGEYGEYDPEAPPEGWDSTGLVMLIQSGAEAIAAVLPNASDILGDWIGEADTASQAKLHTLVEELASLVLPESILPTDVAATWVDDLSLAMASAGVANGASLTPIALTKEGETRQLSLVWPCTSPAQLLPALAAETASDEPQQADKPAPAPARPKPTDLSELPPYAKHLLKIEVPVSVRLVSKKLSVQELLELGPGAMISFDKSCDDALELTVRNQTVARGTAVKVGERFGLEIEAITLPEEHFWPVRRTG